MNFQKTITLTSRTALSELSWCDDPRARRSRHPPRKLKQTPRALQSSFASIKRASFWFPGDDRCTSKSTQTRQKPALLQPRSFTFTSSLLSWLDKDASDQQRGPQDRKYPSQEQREPLKEITRKTNTDNRFPHIRNDLGNKLAPGVGDNLHPLQVYHASESLSKRCIAVVVALLISFFIAAARSAQAACHVVTPNGAGSRYGSTWNNAMAAFPAAMVRGDGYYVATGN